MTTPWPCLLLSVLLLAGGSALAGLDDGVRFRPVYDVRFEGVPRALRVPVRAASLARELNDQGLVSRRILERRARKDEARIRRVLEGVGYFAATVEHGLTGGAENRRYRVTYRVQPGPLFQIGDVHIVTEGATEPLGGFAGKTATDGEIRAAGEAAVRRWKTSGYPWAQRRETVVRVRRADAEVDLEIAVDPASRAVIGAIELSGLNRVNRRYIEDKIAVSEGDLFTQQALEQTRKNLAATELFSVLRVEAEARPDAQGRVPIRIELGERKYRTVSLSVRYETDQGAGAALGLEHRNLMGRGQQLRTRLDWDELGADWENRLRIPDVLRPGQDLTLRFDLGREETDAYEADEATLGASMGRALAGSWRGSLGTDFHSSRVREADEEETFQLLSVPVILEHNTSNHALDPDRGHRLTLRAGPYFNLETADDSFTRGTASLRQYVPLMGQPRLVLAGRITVGSIGGASRDAVPANERLYAGGGGSIRGYEYQLVGPLDAEGDPEGGRSLLEGSVELRGMLTESVGLALFLDGGTVSESTVPGDGEDLLLGAGVGLRYATPIGPLRADIGFPLDRRDGVDEEVQLYISIGQAF